MGADKLDQLIHRRSRNPRVCAWGEEVILGGATWMNGASFEQHCDIASGACVLAGEQPVHVGRRGKELSRRIDNSQWMGTDDRAIILAHRRNN